MSVIYREYAADPRPHIEMPANKGYIHEEPNTFFMTVDELMTYLRKRKAIK